MGHIGVHEFFVVMFAAVIRIGIPVAVAVWVILALRRLRADNDEIKSRLAAIESRLQGGN